MVGGNRCCEQDWNSSFSDVGGEPSPAEAGDEAGGRPDPPPGGRPSPAYEKTGTSVFAIIRRFARTQRAMFWVLACFFCLGGFWPPFFKRNSLPYLVLTF